MSSTYRSICASHVPALVSEHELGRQEALAGLPEREGHPDCDLLIGRWSGALIEIACPGDLASCRHSIEWVDDGWLRVAAEAADLAVPGDLTYARLRQALNTLPPCWTPRRLEAVRLFLRREDGDV
jgi:hypothetical protein